MSVNDYEKAIADSTGIASALLVILSEFEVERNIDNVRIFAPSE